MSSRESGWRELRLKHVIRSNPTKAEVRGRPADLPVSFVPMDAVGEYGGLNLSQERAFGEISSGYTYFRDGDVVVAKITPCFENGKGALANNLRSGIAFGTTELHVLRPRDGLDPRFLFYLTISDRFRKLGEASMYGAGGQKRISEDFVEEYKAAIPPLDEQRTVAAFLDRETARIDTLNERKRRLLDLLEQKRTALITRAVTRGLDPDVPMKDSGVEWIGEIPEHWEVAKLRHCGQLIAGPFGSSLTKDMYGGETYRVYGQEQVIPDDFSVGNYFVPEETFRSLSRYQVQPNDILVSCVGTFGRCAVVPSGVAAGVINPRLVRIRPKTERVEPHFLTTYIRSKPAFAALAARTRGGTMDIVNKSLLSALEVTVPPLMEQRRIVEHVEQGLDHLQSLVEHVAQAVSLLQEYRTAIISAALTGKIDVREKVRDERSPMMN